jgi:predicted transcriptional regulator
MLVENGLLEYDKRTLLYKTTDKGARFLKIHEQLSQLVQMGLKE